MKVVDHHPAFELTTFTISLWFRGGPGIGVHRNYTFVDLHHGANHGAEGHGWVLMGDTQTDRISMGGHLEVVNCYDANTLVYDGAWHHLVATRENSGSTTIYIDGEVCASGQLAPFAYIETDKALTIGRWGAAADEGVPANVRDFSGWLDDVQIYDEPLGPSEVDYLYDNPGRVVVSAIPTVSEWGLVAMALLVLSAGTVVMVRRRVAQVA